MAAAPKYKVNNDHGDYIASFKHAEDAARFVGGMDGYTVTHNHRRKLWIEGREAFSAAESFDGAAAIMWARENGQTVSQFGAEAFNVLHETGSTPRELETALADLVATAGTVEGMMDGDKDKQEAWAEELSRLYIALDAARSTLFKYQPVTPA